MVRHNQWKRSSRKRPPAIAVHIPPSLGMRTQTTASHWQGAGSSGRMVLTFFCSKISTLACSHRRVPWGVAAATKPIQQSALPRYAGDHLGHRFPFSIPSRLDSCAEYRDAPTATTSISLEHVAVSMWRKARLVQIAGSHQLSERPTQSTQQRTIGALTTMCTCKVQNRANQHPLLTV